jgi:glutamine synthetase
MTHGRAAGQITTTCKPKGVFMKTAKDVLKSIKDNDVKYVDLRFTDPRGKWQHVTFDVGMIDEEVFAEGLMFDGSSIAGWKAINESDMALMPDPVTATIDPFFAETTMILTCDVLEPTTGEPYNRDPRGMAKKAEAMVKSMGVGDTVFFGPEAEFFVFDDVRYQTTPYNTGFKLDSSELPINSDTEYEGGNLGHRIRTKAGYFPVPPQDSVQDMRSEMLGAMAKMGVKVEKHHHEVASAQHELGMKFDTLTLMADQMQIYKYCIHQVAHIYGKTATFMPKPVYGDNGSGMHCHQSIWKDGKPVFAGNKYADLSETCLSYIAGIIKHAKAINAFTNPSTNSYKRLVPGYEAPVLLAYSARNLLPHPLHHQSEGQTRRGPFPRSDGQSVSRLRGDADGRSRRRQEQARSGPGDGQGPLRPAEGRVEVDPDGVRLASRGARESRQGPRVPQARWRLRRRLHRQLYPVEDDRSRTLRNDAASGRIRNVLLAVIFMSGFFR